MLSFTGRQIWKATVQEESLATETKCAQFASCCCRAAGDGRQPDSTTTVKEKQPALSSVLTLVVWDTIHGEQLSHALRRASLMKRSLARGRAPTTHCQTITSFVTSYSLLNNCRWRQEDTIPNVNANFSQNAQCTLRFLKIFRCQKRRWEEET